MEKTGGITLKYIGTDVRDGSIDVRKLAPSLMEFSKLLDEINKEINQGEPLRIDVIATKHGSFEIDLIIGIINSDHVQDLFIQYQSIKGILKELFKLKKFLKGKPAKEIKEDPANKGTSIVINGDNNQINISNIVIGVDKNENIGESLEKFTRDSIISGGIDEMDLIDPDTPEDKIKVTKNEIDYYQKLELEEPKKIIIGERKQEASFSIFSLAFSKKNKWKLKDSRGQTVSVHIEDENFLNKVMRGDISFSVKDLLECIVTYTEYQDSKGELKAENYKIIEVKKHLPYLTQKQLL